MTIIRCNACNSPFGHFYTRIAHPDQYRALTKLMGKKLSAGFMQEHANRVLILTPNQDYRPNETIVGCIEVIPLSNPRAYLGRLSIKRQFRKNGLALRLIDEALRYCTERKLTAIYALTNNKMPLGKHGWIKSSEFVFSMYVPKEITVHCLTASCNYWAWLSNPKKEGK